MIYERIKALCEAHGISISELERRTGLGNAVIAGWKKYCPRSDNLIKVARELGTTVEDLMKEVA